MDKAVERQIVPEAACTWDEVHSSSSEVYSSDRFAIAETLAAFVAASKREIDSRKVISLAFDHSART